MKNTLNSIPVTNLKVSLDVIGRVSYKIINQLFQILHFEINNKVSRNFAFTKKTDVMKKKKKYRPVGILASKE